MKSVTSHIAILYVDLFIGEAQSLKEKRMVLKRLKDRIHSKFNVSIAELDGHDKWQVSLLGLIMMGTDKRYLDSVLQNALNFVDKERTVEVCDHQIEFI